MLRTKQKLASSWQAGNGSHRLKCTIHTELSGSAKKSGIEDDMPMNLACLPSLNCLKEVPT